MSFPLYANLTRPENVLALDILNAISMCPCPGSMLSLCVRGFSTPFELIPVNSFVSIVNFIGCALGSVVALGTHL